VSHFFFFHESVRVAVIVLVETEPGAVQCVFLCVEWDGGEAGWFMVVLHAAAIDVRWNAALHGCTAARGVALSMMPIGDRARWCGALPAARIPLLDCLLAACWLLLCQ
jgi:hypothetical protein